MQGYNSEMEIYRYLAGVGGGVNDAVTWAPTAVNYSYSGGCGGGGGGGGSGSSSSFYHAGLMMMMDNSNKNNDNESGEADKAIVASRIHHKEAEKRRRERINSHLDRLRSLLPCTSKTDKATLLSKVVQRVLELKRQTSELLELDNLMIPSENDDFAVYIHDDTTNQINNNNPSSEEDLYHDENINIDDNNVINDNNNRVILRASLCCEDRPDLFTDLNGVLDSLNLKTIRAEISSLGGRVQSVLIVSADNTRQSDECAVFLRDALKGVMQRSGSEERLKRRRRVFDSNC